MNTQSLGFFEVSNIMNESRSRLRGIVNTTETRSGRIFDAVIQLLIVVSLISFALETEPNLTASERQILATIEIICIAIFTVEYFLRIWVADKPTDYIFSFYGLIDLAAIVPFYLSAGLDLKSLRALRLLRVFRILKLVRFNEAFSRIDVAFDIAKAELTLFLSISLIIIYLSGVGIYYFENAAQPELFSSIMDSLWWAVVTLTTVGYGDMYPVTAGGRFFTTVILFVGLGLVAVPAGIVSSALSEARKIQDEVVMEDSD